MMTFLQQLPRLEPYANPKYFLYIVAAVLPIFIGLFFKKRFPTYEAIVSFIFIVLMFTGSSIHQLQAFLLYLVWQVFCVSFYKTYRKKQNQTWVFYIMVLLAILPLTVVKVTPAINGHQSLFGFLGISYLTFRSVGMIMEMRDGTLKDFRFAEFMRFLLFLPTFSSGPIDRFRRFKDDYDTIPDREELLLMLERAVHYLILGFLYKFIIAYFLDTYFLPFFKEAALIRGGYFNWETVGVMYSFGLDLFFDFAGYSMFAVGISYLMGIKTPVNFNRPFLSTDLKEFWNRWHMSLSFWFRDFVFMRLVLLLVKKKVFSNRNVTSSFAYLVNMLIMGFWHGVTWYYTAYGLFHGIGLVINDAWTRKRKLLNKNRKKQGLPPLAENRWTRALGILITFNLVMLSFLIFSGFLDTLWFHN